MSQLQLQKAPVQKVQVTEGVWKEKFDPLTGCAKDYIGLSDIRLFRTGNLGEGPPENPVERVQQGMPVLYYAPERASGGKFEQRVLKVDDQMDFLYVMVDSASTMGRKYGDSNPIVLKVDQIADVHGTGDALDICHERKIFDSHLTSESAVVLELKPWDGADPKELFVFFIAPPQQHLRVCLLACKRKIEAFSSRLTEAQKWRLAGVRLVDFEAILNSSVGSTLRFEYHLKPDDEVASLVPLDSHRSEYAKVSMPLDTTAEEAVEDIRKDNNVNFHAVDAVRVADVIAQANFTWVYLKAAGEMLFRKDMGSDSKQMAQYILEGSKEIEVTQVLDKARIILSADNWESMFVAWQETKDSFIGENQESSMEEATELQRLKAPRIAMDLLLSIEQELLDQRKKLLADKEEELPKCPVCGLKQDKADQDAEDEEPQYEQLALDEGDGGGAGDVEVGTPAKLEEPRVVSPGEARVASPGEARVASPGEARVASPEVAGGTARASPGRSEAGGEANESASSSGTRFSPKERQRNCRVSFDSRNVCDPQRWSIHGPNRMERPSR
jgi:hypothetical protein